MIAHVLFKAAAAFTYVAAGTLGTGYVLTFVLVTLLSAIDFWAVKNVTGRLLVGLRWWNSVDPNTAENTWHFESHEDERSVHPTESNVFWTVLFVTPGVWAVLSVLTVFSFRFMWLLLALVAFGMSAVNAWGYVQCKRDAGKKLAAFGGNVLARGMQAWTGAQETAGKMAAQGGKHVQWR